MGVKIGSPSGKVNERASVNSIDQFNLLYPDAMANKQLLGNRNSIALRINHSTEKIEESEATAVVGYKDMEKLKSTHTSIASFDENILDVSIDL